MAIQSEPTEQPEIVDKKAFTLPPVEPIKIVLEPLKQVSEPIFAKVQTQLPTPHEEGQHFQTKIIDGKTYKVHMPTDPAEKFLCDGCQ